ncbi:PhzF family phenazine biosynthesis protein [Reichenbachiella sp. MSK19-1]|uniref:PhzF family phenazine biosynthesis protein n=1 Tax=Reichenbachiella sp. MSK19-1 TaxID=1897631 RepID=UPI000E6C03B4|nr:PhzF family phenazine biosynthesis protein [Reichenbachiella sp. MSK19-1]RJE74105.1 hypothetical protein BGP76_12985 [Reichenbachiella sp. MSK19-1]
MKIKTFTLDAFTDQPFTGNPAAICLLKDELSDALMQRIAQEFNLSETAYLVKNEGYYAIRYFSPIKEIPLCGHATLSAAKVMFSTKQMDEVTFRTASGLDLTCYKVGHEIMMKFPLYDTVTADTPDEMLAALGLEEVVAVRRCDNPAMLLLEIEGVDRLKGLTPDFVALLKSYTGINGVIVTAQSEDEDYDFYSRFFWPWAGGEEDPVTGAAHTILAKYWSDKLGKTDMRAYQASARGGYMQLKVTSDTTLEITSNAVIVHTGELLL